MAIGKDTFIGISRASTSFISVSRSRIGAPQRFGCPPTLETILELPGLPKRFLKRIAVEPEKNVIISTLFVK